MHHLEKSNSHQCLPNKPVLSTAFFIFFPSVFKNISSQTQAVAEGNSWFPSYKPFVERSARQPSSEHGTEIVNGIGDKSGGLAPQKPITACYKRRILFLRLEMHPWVWRKKKEKKKARRVQESKGSSKAFYLFIYLSMYLFIYCSWSSEESACAYVLGYLLCSSSAFPYLFWS